VRDKGRGGPSAGVVNAFSRRMRPPRPGPAQPALTDDNAMSDYPWGMTNNSSSETTLVLVKPDGVRRGLVGEVIARIERKHLTLVAVQMLRIDDELAHRHYAAHVDKPFFADLLEFITSGPVVAIAVQGEGAVGVVRNLMGATDPKKAAPGTIRGDFGLQVKENLVHGSDGMESAEYELGLFFPELFSRTNA
jgi:nucleoside-diphosphate kinase